MYLDNWLNINIPYIENNVLEVVEMGDFMMRKGFNLYLLSL